jgi:SAM-dependent methyltransferase
MPRGRRAYCPAMPISPDASDAELRSFYEDCYTPGAGHGDDADAARAGRWRALCARGKADHVRELCARAALSPGRVLEVGCGDWAILGWLAEDRFAPVLDGCELSQAAVAIASARPGVGDVRAIGGDDLPYAGGSYDLGVISHVLEHVHDPASLLRETARVCHAVVVEVPLEDNASARRPAKREHALEIGHLQRFSRAAMHDVVARAGLRVAAELSDPLPREVHRFWADDAAHERRADARWLARRALMTVPPLGRRAITVHWAAACLPAGSGVR